MNIISIVGSGPGAIDLLTIRAEKRIKEADVILWTDSLVAPAIIDLASNNCEKIKTSNLNLDQIIKLLSNRYNKGKKVVRLHDGDPSLYGAISEQICRLTDLNIKVEVIPGISAYQATSAKLNSELTIPGLVQTIILSRAAGITGTPENETIERLASIKSSLCIYLSARHVEKVQSDLLKFYPSDTPVAIAHRVSWPEEWIRIVPLIEMAAKSREQNLIRTTLYIISPALKRSTNNSNLYNPSFSHLFRKNSKQ
mgnify:CR=1 FL=1|tara:strand:+ start:681 stop:1442 length:762 start_codon:yes stop_codon:yes gene_type:complete